MKLRWGWAVGVGVLASCSTDVCAPGGGSVCTFGAYDDGFDGAIALDAAALDAAATDAGRAVDASTSALVVGIDGGIAAAGRK